MPTARKTAGWLTVCVALTSGAEGLRQNAYQDVTGTWTACYGETKGISRDSKFTTAQCKAMLEPRLQEFAAEVERCTAAPLPDTRKAALTDFAYNVGSATYCRNVARYFNSGDIQGGCDRLLLYTKAAGITLPGLVKRRQKERDLCLA